MKTITNITYLAFALFALACFALAPAADAQCPQICDSNFNTALGNGALISNTNGVQNTSVGSQALTSNTTGGANVGIGYQALFSNSTVSDNVAVGNGALYRNSSGMNNTAIGTAALYSNQGSENVAIGDSAAFFNAGGANNTTVGASALFNNATGSNNCAFGHWALLGSSAGEPSNNTAIGMNALLSSFGANNVAVGYNAGQGVQGGDNNIFIGASAGQDVQGFGSNNIEIGTVGNGNDNGQIRIGKKGVQTVVHIAGIAGSTVASGVAVLTDNLGHLGTLTSSARFKEQIKPMDKASEAILALKPVTFRYKRDLDPEGIPQFGLVAEDVEKVNPDLVARDEQGKPYTVRYEAVNAMLLNEFLKEHHMVQELKKAAAKQEATIAKQQKEIETLTVGLQKVSAQLAVSKLTPQTAANNQ